MKSVKKIEIVTGTLESKKITRMLDEHQVSYTIVNNVMGKGDKGYQDGDGLHAAFQNRYFLIACSEEKFEEIVDPLRKILAKSGGMCLVTDAQWLLH